MSIFGKSSLRSRAYCNYPYFNYPDKASARNNIFLSGKKHLVADTPLCQNQQKTRFWPSQGRRPSGPLNSVHILILIINYCIITFISAHCSPTVGFKKMTKLAKTRLTPLLLCNTTTLPG